MKGFMCLFLIGQTTIIQSASLLCDCGASTMTCSKQQLTAIPLCQMTTSVQILDVSYNNLIVIPNNSFTNFPNVKNICLNNAHIKFLEPDAFQGLPLLEKVDLSNNYIEHIGPNTFTGSTNLHTVILSNNVLQISPYEPVLISSSVATLGLSHCRIRRLSNKALSGVPGLQTLDLTHNSLVSLSPDTFTGLANLTVVDVRNNEWKCSHNFTAMMCWLYERGQQAVVPANCYDERHNRQRWTITSCLSVTTTTTKASATDVTLVQHTTEAPEERSNVAVTWHDPSLSYNEAESEDDWLTKKEFSRMDIACSLFITLILIFAAMSVLIILKKRKQLINEDSVEAMKESTAKLLQSV